jgi:hypothetical protein
VFGPPVEVQPEILDSFLLRKMYAVYMDWGQVYLELGMGHSI